MSQPETLIELKEDMEAIRKWSRIQGLETLRGVVEKFDDTDLVMFNEADGESTTSEIGDAAGVGNSTVSRKMKAWSNLGIVEKDGRQWKHLAPLKAMGIEEPQLEKNE